MTSAEAAMPGYKTSAIVLPQQPRGVDLVFVVPAAEGERPGNAWTVSLDHYSGRVLRISDNRPHGAQLG